ncbi:MAG TPA: pilus assembly protein TadE [Planctomycetaceae bacterium]|nr:pilus assembly protein TadE [Planctomycetaceae bacterium]
MSRARKYSTRHQRSRRAVAVSELAITLPILVLIVLGTIEVCSMIFLQQGLRISAYEGARVALVPVSDSGNVQAACQQVLDDRRISSGSISVQPSNLDQQPYGSIVQVTVTAPCSDNSLFAPFLFTGRTLTGQMQMMIER